MVRVNYNTVKKWGIGLGISGTSLIALVFIYLSFFGYITIDSYSSDMVCAGTLNDPCYAYINFTANENIFLYPTNLSMKGDGSPFVFDKELRDWKLEVLYGEEWFDIDLTSKCSNLFCGGKNDITENAYSLAFFKGNAYQIRLVGFKEDPLQVVKWGAFGKIDPVWDSVNEDTFFKELKKTDTQLTTSIFTFNNIYEEDISSKNLEIDFDKVCGDVVSYTFEYKTNCTKEIKTPVLKKIEICGEERGELYAKDGCIIDEVVDYYITSYETYECWQETDKLPIGVRDYKIKVLPKISSCGDSWGYKIDWIPTLKTTNTLTDEVSEFTKEEWAWFNSTWQYRNLLNVSHIDRSVYNASVKVKLNTTNFNYSLANTTGQDIRFALDNGTMLDHYIQSWNTSGESRIWVRMPYLEKDTNTTIYIYYGNPEATSISNMTNVFGTGLISFWDFDNNDVDVWNQNNVSSVTGTVGYNLSASGEVNGSRQFYGKSAGGMLNVGKNTIDLSGPSFTMISSIYPLAPAGTYAQGGNYPILISQLNNGYGIVISHDADGNRVFLTKVGVNGLYDVGAFPYNQWSNLAVKYNESNKVYFYWNGSSNSDSAYSSTFNSGLDYLIGGRGTTELFNGSIDYIKVYNRELSDNEISNLSLVYEPTISYFGDMESGDIPFCFFEGVVVDESDTPIDNATVIIINQADNSIVTTTQSNATGGWSYNMTTMGNFTAVAYDPNNNTRYGTAEPFIECIESE